MSFIVPCVHEHASLSCPFLSWFFPALPKDPFPSFGNCKVFWSSHCLGSLGAFLAKARLSFLCFFLLSLRPRAHPFMSLGFLLPILNGPWLADWAFLIFKGPLVLDFNTGNILDPNTSLWTFTYSLHISSLFYLRFYLLYWMFYVHARIFEFYSKWLYKHTHIAI